MLVKTTLLTSKDIQPYGVENPEGQSAILFVSDHAGRRIPSKLDMLGLDETELSRHISHDIGIYAVTSQLARNLGATYIFQPYSRLVIDCNRRPGKPQSIVTQSDGTVVPGNTSLSAEDISAREREILHPYQDRIASELCRRADASRPAILFAMHSCAERLRSDLQPRPWQIGVIAERDWRIGTALIDVLRAETDVGVGVNEPYTVDMEMDYTLPVHAEGQRIPYVEIEIRQDLIADEQGQREWAARLMTIVPKAILRSGILGG